MKRFARLLLVTAGFGVLGFVMSLAPQKNATAQSGPTVTIVSPLPLPVKGNVNATVTGTVNVGNVPNVDVANTPTVNFAAGSGVNVSNPLDAQSNPTPLATLDAFQPYQDRCTVLLNGTQSNFCNFQAIAAGKRLVIQEVDVLLEVDSGLKPLFLSVDTGIPHYFTATFMGSGGPFVGDVFATHQETHLYVGKGQTPVCDLSLSGAAFSSFDLLTCSLSGFLVDVP